MKNNKGFGKFEVLTIIVVLLGVFAYLAYTFLGGTSKRKLETMKESAISFSRAASTNMSSFHNTENAYLEEAIDEKVIGKIKNPVGGGYCSPSESFVSLENGTTYVTLRCGDILIDHTTFSGNSEVTFYEVGKWEDKKTEEMNDQKTLYNCEVNGKELFDEYYEEFYFVYQVNKKFGSSYYFASTVSPSCKVLSKTFYRTKKELE